MWQGMEAYIDMLNRMMEKGNMDLMLDGDAKHFAYKQDERAFWFRNTTLQDLVLAYETVTCDGNVNE